jgi:hypothetical protein
MATTFLKEKRNPEAIEDDMHINIKAGGSERGQVGHAQDFARFRVPELGLIERSRLH